MEKDNALKVPLKEQENLKELFRLLEQNGMEQEKRQVVQMADYIDTMEEKMGEQIPCRPANVHTIQGIRIVPEQFRIRSIPSRWEFSIMQTVWSRPGAKARLTWENSSLAGRGTITVMDT